MKESLNHSSCYDTINSYVGWLSLVGELVMETTTRTQVVVAFRYQLCGWGENSAPSPLTSYPADVLFQIADKQLDVIIY